MMDNSREMLKQTQVAYPVDHGRHYNCALYVMGRWSCKIAGLGSELLYGNKVSQIKRREHPLLYNIADKMRATCRVCVRLRTELARLKGVETTKAYPLRAKRRSTYL